MRLPESVKPYKSRTTRSGASSGKQGGGGENRRTPVKADQAKGHAGDGDPGKTTGKKREPNKADKTTVGEGQTVKTTGGDPKDPKGPKGDAGKSTGKDKSPGDAADGPESGKGPPGTGSAKSPSTGTGTKTPASARPPLMSDAELNQPVLQAKRAKGYGPPRRLEPAERKVAKEVLSALEDVRAGNKDAVNRLESLRPHLNSNGEFAGWYGVDLRPGNPGALNVMRIYFKKSDTGDFKVMLRQGH